MEVSVEEVTEDQHKRQNGPGSGKTRERGRRTGARRESDFCIPWAWLASGLRKSNTVPAPREPGSLIFGPSQTRPYIGESVPENSRTLISSYYNYIKTRSTTNGRIHAHS
jgi:hypothetical protein